MQMNYGQKDVIIKKMQQNNDNIVVILIKHLEMSWVYLYKTELFEIKLFDHLSVSGSIC